MRLAPLIAVLALSPGCKRADPHERAAPPTTTAPTTTDPVVPAGSLVAPTLEAWYGIMLPTPATEALIAPLLEAARTLGFAVNPGGAPVGRWIDIHTSTPEDAGFGDGHDHDLPNLRGVTADELDVEGAFVIGAGGPAADLEPIHEALASLAFQGATAGQGWILDEQTKALFSAAAFSATIIGAPRSFVHLVTFFVSEADDGVVLTSSGMGRFGLPDLIIHLGAGADVEAWAARVDAAGQALVDRGALDDAGLLIAGDQRWGVTWAVDAATGEHALELTPIP